MGLKRQIDVQMYNRNRESLGTTKDVTSANISFTLPNAVSMLYRLPYSWIKKSYSFYRRDIDSRQYSITDFLDYYGAINTETLSQINDIGMSGSINALDNYIFSASVRSSQANTCKISFTSSGSLYVISAIYCDGKWQESFYKNITETELSISIPAGKDCIIAIVLYSPLSAVSPSTVYNMGFGFTNKLDYWGVGSLPIDTPTWNSNIELLSDEATYTLKNSLKWNPPYNKLSWSGTKVKRALIQEAPHNIYTVSGTNVLNGFYLSSANVYGKYPPGKSVFYDGNEYTVLQAIPLSANKIINSGFISTAGWTTLHTVNAGTVKKSSAYATKDGAYDNDKCVKFDLLSTATGSTTAYIQTTTVVPVSAVPHTFMYHVKMDKATSFVPYWKFLYYTTNSPSTLCTRSSATFTSDTVSSAWGMYGLKMSHANINSGIITDVKLPTSCNYIRPRFYACYGQKPAYTVYLDCVGLYATANQYIYNSSSSALDAISVAEHLTSAKNNSTYDIFPLANTTTGVNGRIITRTTDAKFVSPYFVNYQKDGAISISEYDLTNYILAGDFTCQNKFRYSNGVTFPTYSSALFSGRVCYMPQSSGKLFVSTTRSIGASFLGFTYNMSVYAKSDADNKQISLIAGHSATDHRYMQNFYITKDWKRYYFNFTASVASASLMTKVMYATPGGGNLYLSGWQVNIGDRPLTFCHDTAFGVLSYGRLSLSAASSDAIFAAPFGSISFNVAFANNSNDVTGHTSYLMAKRKTTGITRYLDLKYDYSTRQLSLYNAYNTVGGTVSHTCNFKEREMLSISLLWDTAYFYLGYNGQVKSLTKKNVHTSNSALYFGPTTSSMISNYYLSNLKIDTAKWDNSFVVNEYKATRYSPSQYSGALQSEDLVIYDVPRIGQSNPIVFEDVNILPLETYSYTLQHYDAQFYSKESVATSIYVFPAVPNKPVKSGYHSAESSVEFYWQHSSIGTLPYYYYVYTNTDNNLKNPLKVFCQTNVATSTYVMAGISHTAFITLRVLPVNRWDLYSTTNAASISGRANHISETRNMLYNSGIDYYFGSNIYDWSTAWWGGKIGNYGNISNTYYYKYGENVGGVYRGKSVLCLDSGSGIGSPLKLIAFGQIVGLYNVSTSTRFTYSHYSIRLLGRNILLRQLRLLG
jgi:hypothetical protein